MEGVMPPVLSPKAVVAFVGGGAGALAVMPAPGLGIGGCLWRVVWDEVANDQVALWDAGVPA
jgi:hypothetical protein